MGNECQPKEKEEIILSPIGRTLELRREQMEFEVQNESCAKDISN